MQFFHVSNIAFDFAGYAVSYVELIGTVSGLVSVYFASRANIFTWSSGIINELFLFILFYQVQLYADMVLQIYFFVVTIYGWYFWKKKKAENPISETSFKTKVVLVILLVCGSVLSGLLFSNIHYYLPEYFKIPSSYPYADSFIMVSSIIATILLAKKKIETWYFWIFTDLICVVIYYRKEIYFLSLVYFIFLIIASYGVYNWRKQLKHA